MSTEGTRVTCEDGAIRLAALEVRMSRAKRPWTLEARGPGSDVWIFHAKYTSLDLALRGAGWWKRHYTEHASDLERVWRVRHPEQREIQICGIGGCADPVFAAETARADPEHLHRCALHEIASYNADELREWGEENAADMVAYARAQLAQRLRASA